MTGNHEAWLGEEYSNLEKLLIDDPDFVESGNGMFDMSAGIISSEIGESDFSTTKGS